MCAGNTLKETKDRHFAECAQETLKETKDRHFAECAQETLKETKDRHFAEVFKYLSIFFLFIKCTLQLKCMEKKNLSEYTKLKVFIILIISESWIFIFRLPPPPVLDTLILQHLNTLHKTWIPPRCIKH